MQGPQDAAQELAEWLIAAVLKTSKFILVFYTYILKSLKDSRYYYGFTSNLDNRLDKHNTGGVVSTKHRTPLTLHYFEKLENKPEALKRERFFKSFEGRKWLLENKII